MLEIFSQDDKNLISLLESMLFLDTLGLSGDSKLPRTQFFDPINVVTFSLK